MTNLESYQVALLVLAVWLVLALAGQMHPLIRSARDGVDWQVVMFRGALLFMGAVVAIRYLFDVSPWLIVAGWFALDVAATLNTIFIRSRAGK